MTIEPRTVGLLILTFLILAFLRPAKAADASVNPQSQAVLSLDNFVQSVVAQNPDIKVQESAHSAAVAEIKSAGALDDPMLSYSTMPLAIGPGYSYRPNVQVSQKIPWPGTLNLRSQAAAANAAAAAYQVNDTQLRLASRARAAYSDWYYAFKAIAINNETIKLVTSLKSVAETAYASGHAPQQDVLQAEVELTRLQNQSLELTRRQRTVQATINALLNSDPDKQVDPPGELPAATLKRNYNELAATALSRHPALKSATANIAASREGVQLAEKAYYPNIQFSAGYNGMWSMPQDRFAVGVAINIPISGQHDGALDAANAKLHQSQFKLASIRNALLADLQKTYAALSQSVDTIDLYTKRLVPLANLNLKAASADYAAGTGTFLEVITAEQQLLTDQLELESARASAFTQLAALDYQTGGAIFSDGNQETLP